MLAERDIVADLSKKIELLEQSQSIARIGSWEYVTGDDSTFWTDEMFHMVGLPVSPRNLISNLQVEGHIHPQDLDLVKQKSEILKEQKTVEYDFRFVTSTGSDILVHAWCEGVFNGNNQLIKVRGTCQNVTSFRRMEEELERQNDMLQQAEETAKLGSWKYNFATQQGYFSESLYHLFGHTPGTFADYFEMVKQQVDPEDLPGVLSTYGQTIRDGIERSADFRVTLQDGTKKYFTSHGKMAFNRREEQIIVGTIQDVTSEHLMQEQLKEQNDFVQKLVDSSVNCVLVLDKELRYILWNKRCEELYSFTREFVIGKTVKEVYEGYDISWFEEAALKALKGENVIIEEQPSVVTGKCYQLNLIPLRDARDEVVNVFVLVHDITPLKELNTELKQQKEFAESLIENSIDCIYAFDANKRIVEWNKQCATFYKKTREEVLGKTIQEIFPSLDLVDAVKPLDKVLAGETVHYPPQLSHVIDRYYESYLVPLRDGNGKITRGLAILHDLTDIMKASQELQELNTLLKAKNNELDEQTSFLQTLLDTSPDLIEAYDKNLRLITYNKACEQKYQVPRETAKGKHVLELFPGIGNTVQFEYLKQVLAGQDVSRYEFTSIRDGSSYLGFVAPLKDEKGNTYAAITIGHDISELRTAMKEKDRLNGELSFTNSELNRINSELASFSYVASHDLQEPLRKIQAFTSLIMVKDFSNISEAGRDYFKRIQTSANRMQQMIDGLLSFSRTNTAPKVFEIKDLSDLLKKVLLKLHPEIESKKASIESDVLPEAHVIPHQFEQLLEHLLSNALKFHKQENLPRISINTRKVSGSDIQGDVAERKKAYHQISIRDNGLGFASEDAEKIFQMFHRLHGKTEFPGTGIGLAICRRIVQNHNGVITTNSEPGRGSTFSIYIPAEDQAISE